MCTSYDLTGTELEVANVIENTINLQGITRTSGFTLSSDPSIVGQLASLSVIAVTTEPIPASGSLTIGLPYRNSDYTTLGPVSNLPMVESSSTLSSTGSYENNGSTQSFTSVTTDYSSETDKQYVTCLFGNTAEIPSNSIITVEFS